MGNIYQDQENQIKDSYGRYNLQYFKLKSILNKLIDKRHVDIYELSFLMIHLNNMYFKDILNDCTVRSIKSDNYF